MSYKKPTPEEFERVVSLKGANLSEVARSLGVSRQTVWNWTKEDETFAGILHDSRKKFFDGILQSSVLLATGLAAYEDVMDKNGNPKKDAQGNHIKKWAGWIERPDGNMARWLLTKLGREEGFGDDPAEEMRGKIGGIPISAWIKFGEQQEE